MILWIEIREEPVRLDIAILKEVTRMDFALSRAVLKTHFQNQEILVARMDSPSVSESSSLYPSPPKPSTLLTPGRYRVTCRISSIPPSLQRAQPHPQGCFLPLVYEDKDLLVLHKDHQTPSIPHSAMETHTAMNAALAHFPAFSGIGPKPLEPGLLHRLDTGTSGLLIFAKNLEEFERLRREWKSPGLKKYYRAIIEKTNPLPKVPFSLDFYLGHDAKSSKKMLAFPAGQTPRRIRGAPLRALTQVLSEKKLTHTKTSRGPLFDLELRIDTGIMHQIRCQLSAIGWPIWGDTLYRGSPAPRFWLHAWRLEIPLRRGSLLKLEAQLPSDWPQD